MELTTSDRFMIQYKAPGFMGFMAVCCIRYIASLFRGRPMQSAEHRESGSSTATRHPTSLLTYLTQFLLNARQLIRPEFTSQMIHLGQEAVCFHGVADEAGCYQLRVVNALSESSGLSSRVDW